MYVVLVTNKELGGTIVFGPYRTERKALDIAVMMRNPFAARYYDPEEYDIIAPKKLEHYE